MTERQTDQKILIKNRLVIDDALFPDIFIEDSDIFDKLAYAKDITYQDRGWVCALAREAALHEAKRPKKVTFVAEGDVTKDDQVYLMKVVEEGSVKYYSRYSQERNPSIALLSKESKGAIVHLSPGLEVPHVGKLVEIHSSDHLELAVRIMSELRKEYGTGRNLEISFEGDFSDTDKATIEAIMSLYTTSRTDTRS